ncbi:IclR family transcriptional regulator [Anaerophilus nitritogenes]|uniref:IclR family transcriptional regulator n=1 Tax=Anaerophilus nitritogenes TaxID=2498136 RepID=UPI00101BB9F2|nr:IclR family transcriptional regulator [Anaerophilus nitritogenes]
MIQSILRASLILDVLKVPDKEFTIADISQKLHLPPSTVHRILQTLCQIRYVIKDERAHTYKLGPALIPLGLISQHNLHLLDFARPILNKLAYETDEDSFLIIKSEYKGLVLETAQSSNPLKIIDKYVYERDLHCGAIRKALLAYQTDDFIQSYISHVLNKNSAFPKMSPQTLLRSIEMIRKTGISFSYGEYINNAMGIGAPVFDFNNEIVASIGIVFSASRVKDDDYLKKLKSTVKYFANKLSVSLGNSHK